MSANKIVIIAGPTATGKTSTSLLVAKEINAEIVNFDSLLFYKEINIGTAKPTPYELSTISHHMVSTHSISSPINAAEYIKESLPIINEIHNKGKNVVLVGGSGFYLQALLHGMYDSITTSEEIRKKSDNLFDSEGIAPFRELLKKNDPASYERYHENDHYRIIRACEHFWMTGSAFSKAREKMPDQKEKSPLIQNGWQTYFCYLDLPRDIHFEIIQKRTREMINNGLLNEVKSLLGNGYTGKEKPLQSIGYKEIIDFIAGDYEDLEACIERIDISTRQLAKAQRTWFKKIDKISYNTLENRDQLIADCKRFIEG